MYLARVNNFEANQILQGGEFLFLCTFILHYDVAVSNTLFSERHDRFQHGSWNAKDPGATEGIRKCAYCAVIR